MMRLLNGVMMLVFCGGTSLLAYIALRHAAAGDPPCAVRGTEQELTARIARLEARLERLREKLRKTQAARADARAEPPVAAQARRELAHQHEILDGYGMDVSVLYDLTPEQRETYLSHVVEAHREFENGFDPAYRRENLDRANALLRSVRQRKAHAARTEMDAYYARERDRKQAERDAAEAAYRADYVREHGVEPPDDDLIIPAGD